MRKLAKNNNKLQKKVIRQEQTILKTQFELTEVSEVLKLLLSDPNTPPPPKSSRLWSYG
jgi:hypothetical protein